jgi:catalase
MMPTNRRLSVLIDPIQRRRASCGALLAGMAVCVPAWSAADAPAAGAAATPAPAPVIQVTPQQLVQDFEIDGGVHPGQRRNHAKGICAAGEFTGTSDAAALSRSPLFAGKSIPVVARFSIGGGNPDASDADPNPRGMALEFRPPGGGGVQHMTMINAPVFAAGTPGSFHELLVAARRDPKTGKPDPAKLGAYFATHPDAMALQSIASKHKPTVSFTQTPYFSIHTFYFIDVKGERHPVKWRFVPRDGVKEMTEAELKSTPKDFLQARLMERIHKGPALWDMIVYVGEPGDAVDNPTIAWPESRKHFIAGTLTISEASPQQKGAACEPINFDPLVMVDGIAPSSDPVLLVRSPAYAVSFGKRLAGQ